MSTTAGFWGKKKKKDKVAIIKRWSKMPYITVEVKKGKT